MTNTQAYVQACWPEPWRILGRRLHPLCLGHELVLQRIGSPFALEAHQGGDGSAPEGGPGLGDLLLAIWVCSRPWRVAAERIGSWSTRAWLRWMLTAMAICRVNVAARAVMFGAYLADSRAMPPVWRLESGSASGPPTILAVQSALTAKAGYAAAEALDLPIGQAWWELVALGHSEGRLRLVTDAEAAIMDARRCRRNGGPPGGGTTNRTASGEPKETHG